MSTPHIILPATPAVSFRDDTTTEIADVPGTVHEKFGDLMERTLGRSISGDRQTNAKSGAKLQPQKKQRDQQVEQATAGLSGISEKKYDRRVTKENSSKTTVETAAAMAVVDLPQTIAPVPVTGGNVFDGTTEGDLNLTTDAQSGAQAGSTFGITTQFFAPIILPSTRPLPAGPAIVSDRTMSNAPTTATTGSPVLDRIITKDGTVEDSPALSPETTGKILAGQELSTLVSQDGVPKSDKTDERPEATNTASMSATISSDQVESPSSISVEDNLFIPSAEVATEILAATGETPENTEVSAKAMGVSTEANGISGAKQDVQMKKSDKKNKIAGATEKVLPQEAATTVAPEENISSRDKLPIVIPFRAERSENNAFNHSASDNRIIDLNPASTDGVSAATPIIDARARAIERTEDMVAVHAMRVRETSNETLNVTIKPGAGIQLSLELRQSENGIEAQVTLQQGDLKYLSDQWGDLQQRLESRGVRLAPLITSEQFSNSNANQFQQSHQQPAQQQDDPAFAGAFAEFVMADPFVKKTAGSIAQRGWESWA